MRERERENHVLEEEALKHPLTDLLLFQACLAETVNSKLQIVSEYLQCLMDFSFAFISKRDRVFIQPTSCQLVSVHGFHFVEPIKLSVYI
jgi:hypothetical protein